MLSLVACADLAENPLNVIFASLPSASVAPANREAFVIVKKAFPTPLGLVWLKAIGASLVIARFTVPIPDFPKLSFTV